MKTTIDISVDGQLFARRFWALIPRVGDVVMLRQGEIAVRVACVVWSEDVPPAPLNSQVVNLFCKTVDPNDGYGQSVLGG
jgi:hypothetical protein